MAARVSILVRACKHSFITALFCLMQVVHAHPKYWVRRETGCKHPQTGYGRHKEPVAFEGITFSLLDLEEKPTSKWTPGEAYAISITVPDTAVNVQCFLTVSAGELSTKALGTSEVCDGRGWVAPGHALKFLPTWTAPQCCAMKEGRVQAMVTTASGANSAYTQNAVDFQGDLLSCDCQDGDGVASEFFELPATSVTVYTPDDGTRPKKPQRHFPPLPKDAVMNAPEVHVTSISSHESGSSASTARSASSASGHVSAAVSESQKSGDSDEVEAGHQGSMGGSVLGAMFAVVAVGAGVAAVVVMMRHNRAMRHPVDGDFGSLEMRGYARWQDEAGL